MLDHCQRVAFTSILPRCDKNEDAFCEYLPYSGICASSTAVYEWSVQHMDNGGNFAGAFGLDEDRPFHVHGGGTDAPPAHMQKYVVV